MGELNIPIDGKQTRIELKLVELDRLVLDEHNPRISFYRDNQVVESLSEDQIIYALTNRKPESFRKLRDSIHNNRGIMNPIWVEPTDASSKIEKYKVIEGNTRFVIYRYIRKEEPSEKCWNKIWCYVLPHHISEEQKNFIRLQSHLRGTTEWDAYEKAKYLYKLWHEDGWPVPRLEKQTKMTEKQIEENIKAYRIMQEQYLPRYGEDPNEVAKFSYFVEYAKDSKLQKQLEKNSMTIKDFCDWVADKEKLPTGQDVRKLRDIFENQDTKDVYISKGFYEAMQILQVRKPYLVSSLYKDIESVIEGLKNLSTQEIDEIINENNGQKEKMLIELAKWSQKIVEMIKGEK